MKIIIPASMTQELGSVLCTLDIYSTYDSDVAVSSHIGIFVPDLGCKTLKLIWKLL